MDAFYPNYLVKVKDYILKTNVEFEVHLNKKMNLDWSRIILPSEIIESMDAIASDVKIDIGYGEEMICVFEGNIASIQNDCLLVKNDMCKLENTYITNTFLKATPQEIVDYCIKKVGIKTYVLSEETFSPKTISIYKKNVIQVMKELESVWDFEKAFLFIDGCFYWGTKPKQDVMYTLKYGESILNMELSEGYWVIESPLLPKLKQSQEIIVEHPKLNGTFEVEKVVFKAVQEGFIRTEIHIKE